MWENEPCHNLAISNELMAYKHKGFWQCVDTKRDKDNLNNLLEKGQIPWH